MKLDYDFVNKSLDEQMILFLNNCTINIEFSQNLLRTIIIELMAKCNNEIFVLIQSEDLDTQKLGSQLLFGEYLYVFNIALSLRHYDTNAYIIHILYHNLDMQKTYLIT